MVLERRTMECFRIQLVAIASFMLLFPNAQGWGDQGHSVVCRIAQARLRNRTSDAVSELLLSYAENDAGVCSWADRIKRAVPWSSALHFADTPDSVCKFQYDRDCRDLKTGEKGRCVVGAIHNYTTQLLNYGSDNTQYNLTEAMLFLSHFMGDIHQPLHCGFVSDRGGNTIDVQWYTTKQNLHHVWDDNIVDTAIERFYNNNIVDFVKAIQENIEKEWSDQVKGWETCSFNEITCPEIYASESAQAACEWAYNGVTEGSVLEDDYFLSRLPIATLRLAQGGVRLAATLNQLFDGQYVASM